MLDVSQATFSDMSTNAHVQGQHSIFRGFNKERDSCLIPESSRVVTNGHPTINRVLEFSNLQDGWYGDEIESTSPSGLSISHALRILNEIPQLLERISVYPMYEGGILFEFEIVNWDYSLRICNSGSFEVCGIKIDGDGSYDAVFDKYEAAVDEMSRMITI